MTPSRLFLYAGLSLMLSVLLQGAELPAGGIPLLKAPAEHLKVDTMPGFADAIAVRPLAPAGVKNNEGVLRVETVRDVDLPWAVRLSAPLDDQEVKVGDVALLCFTARTLASADETGAGRINVTVDRGAEDYDRSLEEQYSIGKDWQVYYAPFAITRGATKQVLRLTLYFGFKHQVVEVKDIALLGYGHRLALAALPRTRFTYAGREPGAAWRKAALARIEKIRKGDFSIEVRDARGAPVPGATVRVDEVKSAFQWGTAIPFQRLLDNSADDKRYRQTVLELFNEASPENDLKWPAWDGLWPENIGHAKTLAALRWLNDQGFYVRGHVLVWPGWRDLPKSLRALKDEHREKEIPAAVLAHIKDETLATKGLIREWDVLNEPYDHRDLAEMFGKSIMVDWFKTAHACVPGVPLYLNDYSNHDFHTDREHCEFFLETAKYLKDAGAPIGGLGIQGHIASQPNDPEHVLEALDRYATLHLPMRITEFDINTSDEELQADYTRDFFILAFSHPSVVGIQLWGFWEKAHWRPKAAMFRADWSEKPNARVYRELVLKEWRTHVQGKTDSAGHYAGRGFHGDYVVTVEAPGRRVEKTLKIEAGSATTPLEVILP